MENMINVCLENKITTFDHADIYGITPRLTSEKHFLQAKSEKNYNLYQMWDPNGYREP
jgi:predicted oxidoreductase